MPYSGGRDVSDCEGFNNNYSPALQKDGSHGVSNVGSNCKSQNGIHDYGQESLRSKEMEKLKGRDEVRVRKQHGIHDYGQESLRGKEMEKLKGRDEVKVRNRDGRREKECKRDCDCHRRVHSRKQSDKKHCVRDKDDYGCLRSRDYVRYEMTEGCRYRDYNCDVEEWHKWRHMSRSRSRDRSQSPFQSRSKSKRMSGFDVPPLTTELIPGTAATGQLNSAIPTAPGQATRHARRVYVGGLPSTVNEQSVATFFSYAMASIGGNTAGPGDSVINVYINREKLFAFVEMRSVEEASNAMALDGITFEGKPVKVSRPTDYNPVLAAALGPSQPNPNLNLAAIGLSPRCSELDGPDRIFVGGIPYHVKEAQMRDLLESFGPLRGFNLVLDRETGNSKGYGFCMYQDLSVTDYVCSKLNGLPFGDKTLTIRRANRGTSQTNPELESLYMQAQQQVDAFRGAVICAKPTKLVCLTQAVSADELKDDKEYDSILEDMETEGRKFGELVKVVIPRPAPNGELSTGVTGVGKVFLEYADLGGATKALASLNGRKFDGRVVVADFYPVNSFAKGEYES